MTFETEEFSGDEHVGIVRRVEGSVPVEAVEQVARWFHEAYERLAPSHGWETQAASRTDWENVPPENKRLMLDTAAVVLALMTDEGMIEWRS